MKKRCNSTLKEFLKKEASIKSEQFKTMENHVEGMETYNSIEEKGMETFLTSIKNTVRKQLPESLNHKSKQLTVEENSSTY